MTESQSPQDDFGKQSDIATPVHDTDQSWPLPGSQSQDGQQQHADPQDAQFQDPQFADQQQQVQPFVPQQAGPPRVPGQYATGLTSAQQVWYTLHCIYFGMGYLAKVPAKKALEDYGMAQLTSAEQFWYTVECILFGAGYFAKLSTAKALSEMPVFQTAGHSAPPVSR
jgi:hypothetical protein